jgi:hypothetical protein
MEGFDGLGMQLVVEGKEVVHNFGETSFVTL